MSDENRPNVPEEEIAPEAIEAAPAPEAEPAPEAAAGAAADPALREELEQLRETFQTEYDKASADEAADAPVIQELVDYGRGREEEEGEEEEETPAEDLQTPAQTAETKKKQKRAKEKGKRPVGLIVALILVIVLLVVPLGAYFVLSVREPNLNAFISAVAAADSAEEPAEAVSKYTEALSYCTEGSVFYGQRQTLVEKCVVATCKANGYSAAISYINSNTDEEARANPKTREFKELLGMADAMAPIFDGAADAVRDAVAEAGSADAVDYEALAVQLGAKDPVTADVADALKTVGAAVAAENAAGDDDDAFYSAMGDYMTAQQAITSLNVTSAALPTAVAGKLFERGFASEANNILQNYLTEEQRADESNEPLAALLKEIDAVKNSDADLAALAERQLAAGKTDRASLAAAMPGSLTDAGKNALARLAEKIAEGLAAKNEKNLTRANVCLTEALSGVSGLGLPVETLAVKAVETMAALGDVSNAYGAATAYLAVGTETPAAEEPQTEDGTGEEQTTENAAAEAAKDAALKALFAKHPDFEPLYNDLNELNQAQTACDEIVSQAYYTVYYSGGTFDAEGTEAQLDALLTDGSDAFMTAYVNYYKYICEMLAQGDDAKKLEYLNAAEAGFGKYAIICANDRAQVYSDTGDTARAAETANAILAVDAGSDRAHALLAKISRIAGDAAAAEKHAADGETLAGKKNASGCAYELTVAALLRGDYTDAYKRAESLYNTDRSAGTLSIEHAAVAYAAAALFKSDDADEQKAADDLKSEIADLFTQSSTEIPAGAAAAAEGTKTPAEVWLGKDAE